MFDIGWTEMAIIALVALVVIGPKDLPGAMRTVGHWVRRIRTLARDFQSGLDDMIRESELSEARKSIESISSKNPNRILEDTLDPAGEVKETAKSLQQEVEREEKGGAPEDASGKTGEPAPKAAPEPKEETKAAAKPEPEKKPEPAAEGEAAGKQDKA
jgi:sec-independent protein translocase protein TatB